MALRPGKALTMCKVVLWGFPTGFTIVLCGILTMLSSLCFLGLLVAHNTVELAHPPEHPALAISSPNFTRTLIVPRLKDEDVAWISVEMPYTDVKLYTVNDLTVTAYPPRNKGHEVIVYLTHIIDNYNDLTDIVIFLHAHRFTHHNNQLLGLDAAQMIKRLKDEHVLKYGYFNLRCEWSPGCPDWLYFGSDLKEQMGKQEESVLVESWQELFPDIPTPEMLAQPCCAQFAVSRQQILTITQQQYIFFRDWILRTPMTDYISGRIWEYTWQYLFLSRSVVCPAEHVCYCCGYGICTGNAANYDKLSVLLGKKLEYEHKLHAADNGAAQNLAGANDSSERLQQKLIDAQMGIRAAVQSAVIRGDDPALRAEECVESTT